MGEKKMRDKTKRRTYILYLLLLLLAMAGTGAVTLARYTSQVLGTGQAVVASFVSDSSVVSENSVSLPVSSLPKKPGAHVEIRFLVTNKKDDKISQVAQNYSLTILTAGNLPYEYKLSGTITGASSSDMNRLLTAAEYGAAIPVNIPSAGGILPPSDSVTHTYTLTISWPENAADPVYADEVEHIELVVDSEQRM